MNKMNSFDSKESNSQSNPSEPQSEKEKKTMTYKEFLQSCSACGGNWGAMLLTGIKRVFPEHYEEVYTQYNSMDFSDGGVKAFVYLYDWLEEHGIIMD